LTLSTSLSHYKGRRDPRRNKQRGRGRTILGQQTEVRKIESKEAEEGNTQGKTYSIGVHSRQEASSGAGPFGREGFAIASESTDRAVLTEGERGRGHELENEEKSVVREERDSRG
jgi:hypothetical protein